MRGCFFRLTAAAGLLAACRGDAPPAPPPRAAPPPAAVAAPPADARPPVAPVRPATDTYFGTSVVDPYRWMEDANSPELDAWMKAQNDFTRSYFGRLPAREGIARRLRELEAGGGDELEVLVVVAGRHFYTKRTAGAEVAKLYVREGAKGPERLLYDPAPDADPAEHAIINTFDPSPDGKYVAVGVSSGGTELGSIRVLDVATGKFLPDRVDRIGFAMFASVSWVDGRRFLVARLQQLAPGAPAADRFKNIRIYLHTLGGDPEREPAVFGAGVSPRVPFDEAWGPRAFVVPGSPYVFGSVQRPGSRHVELYVAPVAALADPAGVPWRRAIAAEDEVVDFDVRGDDLCVIVERGAPRRKVMRTSLRRPDLARAVTVVPESERILTGVSVLDDALYVTSTERGLGRLSRLPRGQTNLVDVPLPANGNVWVTGGDPSRPRSLYIWLTSWLSSRRLYAIDAADKPPVDTGLQPAFAGDLSAFEAVEVEATSADGTCVPLSIVARKGLRRDGSSPAILQGYGAYGSSMTPSFEPHNVAFFERAVFAVCHVRGGGELGREWHEQGRGPNKHHAWEDFIGCGEYLVAKGYTSPPKLVAMGYSAGGITAGNAAVRRPDLFAALVHRMGSSNPLRSFAASPNRFGTAENGTPETKAGFEALYAMDVYHHVRDGTKYPAALVTNATNDARVPRWHATKLAARLQAASASGRPALLRVEYGGGHGVDASASQQVDEFADILAFALAETGSL